MQIIESVKRATSGEAVVEGEKIGSQTIEALKAFSEDEIETLVLAQGLNLFSAGTDTTSHGLALCIHHMANNRDVQEKLYNEVMDVIEENGGDQHLDYNALQKLTYMDKVIKESLRSQGISFLERKCTKDYYIPEVNFTVPKGMIVTTAGSGIMHEVCFCSSACGGLNTDFASC